MRVGGDETWREHPFTVAGASSDGGLRPIIRSQGRDTSRMYDRLQPGLSATVTGPYGMFDFTLGHAQQIWIAGGIGIAPFLSWLEVLKPTDPYTIDLSTAPRPRPRPSPGRAPRRAATSGSPAARASRPHRYRGTSDRRTRGRNHRHHARDARVPLRLDLDGRQPQRRPAPSRHPRRVHPRRALLVPLIARPSSWPAPARSSPATAPGPASSSSSAPTATSPPASPPTRMPTSSGTWPRSAGRCKDAGHPRALSVSGGAPVRGTRCRSRSAAARRIRGTARGQPARTKLRRPTVRERETAPR